jgi:hypothetical protein
MLSSHGSNKEQIDAITDFLKSASSTNNVSLSEDLMNLAQLTAQEVVKILVQEDRKEFIRDVFNEHDTGYGENVRIAFENEVMRKAAYARPTEGSPETASKEFITESKKEARAAIRPKPIKSSYEEILPLLESISDFEFDTLAESLSEENQLELMATVLDDYDFTLDSIAEDISHLDEETLDEVVESLTEEELESVIDAYEYVCESNEILEEGIGSDAKAAASAAYKKSKAHSEMGARYKGRNTVRKIGAFALKAARKYAGMKKAAGAPVRAAGAGLAAAKSYVDSVRKGATNAATNAARRGRDKTKQAYASAKSGTSNFIKKSWNGIKSVGKKIKHAVKYAVGKGVNFLTKQGRYANKVDAVKGRKNARPSKNTPLGKIKNKKAVSTVTPPSTPTTAPAAKKRRKRGGNPGGLGESSVSNTPGKAQIMSSGEQKSAAERLAAIAARNADRVGNAKVLSQAELLAKIKKNTKQEKK